MSGSVYFALLIAASVMMLLLAMYGIQQRQTQHGLHLMGGDMVVMGELPFMLRIMQDDRLLRPNSRANDDTGRGLSGAPTRVRLPSRPSSWM